MRLVVSAILISASLAFTHCRQETSGKIDLAKAKTGFLLQDGSSISSATADDYSPVLFRKPDGNLILVFASNRTCGGCTGGQHYMFLAQSVTAYDGSGILPRFNTPLPVKLGTPHAIFARGSIAASWYNNSVQIFARAAAGNIFGYQITLGNLATATTSTPDAFPNSLQDARKFLSFSLKDGMIITQAGGNAFHSSGLAPDPGATPTNEILGQIDSLALIPQTNSGSVGSSLMANEGRLHAGTLDTDYGEVDNFNEALVENALYLSKISVLPSSVTQAGALVFSAGSSSEAQQDLYAVTNFDAADFWILMDLSDSDFKNSGPYRIFESATMTNGNLGGVSGADIICKNDAANPDIEVTFKALLTATGSRVATTNGTDATGQLNWVLQPNEVYLESVGLMPVGLTDGFGLMLVGPMMGPFGSANGWTGFALAANWTTGANTCSNWTNGTSGASGFFGANSTGAAAMTNTAALCNVATHRVYCVEQP